MKRELGREVTDGIPLVPVKVRELAPGVSWIIGCIAVGHGDTLIHSHASAYLLTGEHHSALIDTGYPRHWPELDTILDELLGDRGLDYIIPTHPEIPHAGLVRQLIDKYPDSVVAGDVRDYHAYFGIPEERLRAVPEGEVLDLGGKRVRQISTPHVPHGWEAQVLFEETTGTLLCGDLFTQYGACDPLTESDIVGAAIASEDIANFSALNPAMGATLRKLAELKPRTLALMHGPAFSGDCESALLALADDYDRRMMAKARDYGLVPAAA